MARKRNLPRLGPWIAWIAVGGAALGYPALLWLDPLALFSGFFGICTASPAGAMTWIAALGLPAVLMLSLFWPGAWCGRICPLGAFQDALFDAPRAILRGSSRHGARPPSAVTDDPSQPGAAVLHASKTRRMFFRMAIGGVAGAIWAAVARAARFGAPRPLRPPGARDETTFLGLCVRCGHCARACPSGIIEHDGGRHGAAGLLAPIIRFRDDYCREDCTRCIEACPSGALERLSPEAKRRSAIGVARVDRNVCLLGDDRECSVCRNRCPFDAITYVFCESDYTLTPTIDPKQCPGCGACEIACPTQPVKAIRIVPLPAG